MSLSAWALVIPLAGFFTDVMVQIALRRLGARLLLTVFAGFFGGLLALLVFWALVWTRGPDPAGLFLTDCVIYGCLGYCYFHCINLSETARRIRILREIYESPSGLTVEDLLERYNFREILDKRLARLLDNGQVALGNGKYVMRPGLMLLITRIFILARRVIMGKDASSPQP